MKIARYSRDQLVETAFVLYELSVATEDERAAGHLARAADFLEDTVAVLDRQAANLRSRTAADIVSRRRTRRTRR